MKIGTHIFCSRNLLGDIFVLLLGFVPLSEESGARFCAEVYVSKNKRFYKISHEPVPTVTGC